jgi:hypothetical protein
MFVMRGEGWSFEAIARTMKGWRERKGVASNKFMEISRCVDEASEQTRLALSGIGRRQRQEGVFLSDEEEMSVLRL